METETLGWMQFKLSCQNHQVAVQALVEQPETKLALDDNWPLLAAGLSSLNLKLASQRCDLGRVTARPGQYRTSGYSFSSIIPLTSPSEPGQAIDISPEGGDYGARKRF